MSSLPNITPSAEEETASALLEDQVNAYKRDGFIIIEDVLQGDELRRVQAAFDKAQARTRTRRRTKPRRTPGLRDGKRQGVRIKL